MKKSCQNPFLAILRLKKIQKKKVPMAIKLEGGGKALVARPLVEELFFAASLSCFYFYTINVSLEMRNIVMH